VDPEEPHVLASYKLPHHDIIDGRLQTVWHGVAAAMAAVKGARGGVKLDQTAKVISHLAKHYKEFGKEVPKSLDLPEPEPVAVSQLVTLGTIERILTSRFAEIDLEKAAAIGVERAFAKRLGRV
jgi:hypothetical protein